VTEDNSPPPNQQETASSPDRGNQRSVDFIEAFLGEVAAGAFIAGSVPGSRDVRVVGQYTPEKVLALPDNERHHITAAVYPVGLAKRADEKALGIWGLVFDDVGERGPGDTPSLLAPLAKIDKSWFQFLLEPSWIHETSKGNFQYGYAFLDLVDMDTARQMRASVRGRHPGLAAGLHSLGQYCRLPSGTNTKPDRGDFRTRMVFVGRSYSLEEFLEGFGLRCGDMGEGGHNSGELCPPGDMGDMGTAGTVPGPIPGPGSLVTPLVETCTVGIALKILKLLPNDSWFEDRGKWVRLAHALRGALGEEGRDLFLAWCDTYTGVIVEGEAERVWDTLPESLASASTLRILVEERWGKESSEYGKVNGWLSKFDETDESAADAARVSPPMLSVDHFWAYAPMNQYIYEPDGKLWPPPSVNLRVAPIGTGVPDAKGKEKTIPATAWLSRHRSVTGLSWLPGRGRVLKGMKILQSGIFPEPTSAVFNLYQEPVIEPGDAAKAGMWLQHVRVLYPGDADWIFDWLAHRVQRPGEKINHGLLLGGAPGVGKDTLLAPAMRAVGDANVSEISPIQIGEGFNGYRQSVILRISELRDLGDMKPWGLYESMKVLLAAPPETLAVNTKFVKEYYVPNVVGVVMTTNHKQDGLYLPPDDRRHYVAWSTLPGAGEAGALDTAYFAGLWTWFDSGGYGHVAAWLRARDLSGFNAKAPPRRTKAWHAIVDANRGSEDASLADALETLGYPDVFTLDDLEAAGDAIVKSWLRDLTKHRILPKKLEGEGYEKIRNPVAKSGRWRTGGKDKVIIYGKVKLSQKQQEDMAGELVKAARAFKVEE
jgi:hypothetical protein